MKMMRGIARWIMITITRIIDFIIDNIMGGIGGMARIIRRTERLILRGINFIVPQSEGPNRTSIPVLLILFIIGILQMAISAPLGLMIIGFTVILAGLGFVEIKTPYLGFLYVRGRLVDQLDPGWYIAIPIIMSIQKKSQEIQKETITESMYTSDKTELIVKAVTFYQVVDLTKAVNISDEEIKEKVRTLMASKTKTVIGKNKFAKLNSEQDIFEAQIKKAVQKEIKNNGYQLTSFELADFDEKVESEAARIRKVGDAEAEIIKKKTEAVKDGVGDSWQGVLAILAQQIGEGIGKKISKGDN